MAFRRGMIINGEFVEGRRNGLGIFVPTKYRRGANGLLVMALPVSTRRRKKPARTRQVKRHKILEFVPGRSIVPARAVTDAARSFCSRKKAWDASATTPGLPWRQARR